MSTLDRSLIRKAFRRPTYFPVKITPEGFEVDDQLLEELRGRVTRATLVRKRFEDGLPTCHSQDGVRAEDGTLCADCLDPRCHPRLKIHLASGNALYVMDLPPTSAQNLFFQEDQAEAQGLVLVDLILQLTVINHDNWGEVVFIPDDNLPPKKPA